MILVLGGTAEGRALADVLQQQGVSFTSSLAGRVARPRMPVGSVLIGGFGGVRGLHAFLAEHRVAAVVDATHPFAAGMSRNAAAACAGAQVPLLRLERSGWDEAPGAQGWTWVDTHAEAAAAVADLAQRPFLTVGRQSLQHFVGPLAERAVVARVVDPPDLAIPESWTLLTSRGPYDLPGELALIEQHRLDAVVTKDSGGSHTWPKLEAAATLGLPVVIVRRPSATDGVETVSDVGAAAAWAVRFGAAGTTAR